MDEYGENNADFDSGGGSNESGGDFNVGMEGDNINIDSNPDTIANLEDRGYDMNMEVTEGNPGADNKPFTEGQTESGDEIPEDMDSENLEGKETNPDESETGENDEKANSDDIPEDEDNGIANESDDRPSVRDNLKKIREDGSDESSEDTSSTEQGPRVKQKGRE